MKRYSINVLTNDKKVLNIGQFPEKDMMGFIAALEKKVGKERITGPA
ncbi:MAG: hypothetical protein AB1529_05175 [Candidatus Micrarchaeota archaeon]